jgi:lactate dehydrogenase-like 2-hydroxyacid dehydrogenase
MGAGKGADKRPQTPTRTPPDIRIGVVGLGYWGPNLARNFAAIGGCELTWLCDASSEARDKLAPSFPSARATDNLDDLLNDSDLDAIVLATPVPTHASLAIRALSRSRSRPPPPTPSGRSPRPSGRARS